MVPYYTRCIVLRGCFAGPEASFGRLSDQLKDTEIGRSSPAELRVTGPHLGGKNECLVTREKSKTKACVE